jgi:hypothetical protein
MADLLLMASNKTILSKIYTLKSIKIGDNLWNYKTINLSKYHSYKFEVGVQVEYNTRSLKEKPKEQ